MERIGMRRLLVWFIGIGLCAGLAAQENGPGRVYRLIHGNEVLTVENSSLSQGAPVVTWPYTGVDAQRWLLVGDVDSCFRIMNVYTGKLLSRKDYLLRDNKINQQDQSLLTTESVWQFMPVSGQENKFLLLQKCGGKTYALAASPAGQGKGGVLSLRPVSERDTAQWWRIEADTLFSYGLSPAMRDDMMEAWKRRYYKKTADGAVLGRGGWWGDAEMFETILDAYETTGRGEYLAMFDQLYRNFIARNKPLWDYNAFNDDVAWMIIACTRAYLMSGNKEYLSVAQTNFRMMYERASDLPHGMLRWKESPDTRYSTNSCINGPAGVAACYLGQATGDEDYYRIARKLYALQRQYLYEHSTGKVYDSFCWEGGKPVKYNYWASTYNQGTFLGAALLLYAHYGDDMYKRDAEMVVKYTRENMCDEFGIVRACQVLTGDLSGFKGILMRYVRRFMVDLGRPEYGAWFVKNAAHAYNNRNSEGITFSAWLTKTPEDYVCLQQGKEVNWDDPFGTSTAVSVAFNAYIGGKTVVKPSPVEAENFDYLRGVRTQVLGGQGGYMLGHVFDGFYTEYRHIRVGQEAGQVRIRVKPLARKSRIKIYQTEAGKAPFLLAEVRLPDASGWQTVTGKLNKPVVGDLSVCLVYEGPVGKELMEVDWFSFH